MILVTLALVVSTAFGVGCERRLDAARVAAQWTLQVMLYALVPFVSFVNISHLRITVGVGIGVAWVLVSCLGLAAWSIGRFWLGLAAPALGALICSVIIVNTQTQTMSHVGGLNQERRAVREGWEVAR